MAPRSHSRPSGCGMGMEWVCLGRGPCVPAAVSTKKSWHLCNIIDVCGPYQMIQSILMDNKRGEEGLEALVCVYGECSSRSHDYTTISLHHKSYICYPQESLCNVAET